MARPAPTSTISQVPELKRRLAELGMETKGTKAELLARVERYLNEQGKEEGGRGGGEG